ncbi:glycosyltransferase [Geodermatophilus sp. CPCC 205506]|uniref:glycosyltransferase n=1 Tax=Geodermatophilus sp. CPCC 205506 TaxID=2936596 RepID=UPI003EECD231
MTSSVTWTPRPLLSVAPLVPAGGVDTLLTAFGLLADDRPALGLDIIGAGPLGRVLQHQAEYLGISERVRFCGHLPNGAVRAAVRRCALLVLPSRPDGSGVVPDAPPALLTALDAARPVVATTAAAPPHALPDRQAGLLVLPDDPIALATAVSGLLDDLARRPAPAGGGWESAAAPPVGVGAFQRLWHRVTG